jgi:hypothetical protein
MLRLLSASIAALRSGFRSRRELFLENLALRQQLATQKRPRAIVTSLDLGPQGKPPGLRLLRPDA